MLSALGLRDSETCDLISIEMHHDRKQMETGSGRHDSSFEEPSNRWSERSAYSLNTCPFQNTNLMHSDLARDAVRLWVKVRGCHSHGRMPCLYGSRLHTSSKRREFFRLEHKMSAMFRGLHP